MSENIQIGVIYGSYREKREGIRAAKMAMNFLKDRCHPVLLDAAEFNLPMLDNMYKEYDAGSAPDAMEAAAESLRNCDGFVVVSGEYNHGMPPGLKNFLDHFQKEYFFKPAGIMTYSAGAFGGVRAAVHVRAVLGELGMPTVSVMLPIPKVQSAIREDGTPEDEKTGERFSRFADELLWYARALKTARANGTPY